MTFPYRFIAAAETGELATSQDAIAWAANGTLPNPGGVVSTWQCGAISRATGRVLFIGDGATTNKFEIAYSDDGDNFTHATVNAAGMGALPIGLLWTDLFNAGRFYCWVRQDGANLGGIWYSDDDGLTWTAMTFAGSPTTNLDIEGFAVGADRLMCAGRFGADDNHTMRLFYSTDGASMLAGATGLTSLGLFQTADNASRSLTFIPDTAEFVYVGASAGGGVSPQTFATIDGVTTTFGPGNTPFSQNASSGNGVWMTNVARLVVPGFSPGSVPHQAFIYSANGHAFTGVLEGSPDPNGQVYTMVYSSGRAVGGQTNSGAPGGFVYTDNGLLFVNVAGPSVKKWRAIATLGDLPIVPDVIGLLIDAAELAITSAGFTVGTVATQETNAFPANSVITQFPPGGTSAAAGTIVSLTIAVPDTGIIPDVIGMTLADAEITIRAAGFLVGVTTITTEPLGPLGTVVLQSPPGGSHAFPGTKVALTSTALLAPFDVDATVISQYSNSPTINRLVENMADYVDPAVDMTNFYNFVWNVDTAVGFGLDIWGDIVGVTRLLRLPSDDPIFGYINEDDPPDWFPFNDGVFTPGAQASSAYLLPDDAFRTLILTKALSNIVATSAASLNELLRNLFPGRGKSYVVDLGNMAMRFVFEFVLTSTEYAILTQSNALPHPAGVSYSVVVLAPDTFGFVEMGPTAKPFDFGVFYLPPA